MKSIFLLCEYGIPLNTVVYLDSKEITIEDIYSDKKCLDKYLGENSYKKVQILKRMNSIMNSEKEYSIYELIKYGLSKAIIDKLYSKNIGIEDINEQTKEDCNIGDSTYIKITTALKSFIEDKHINLGLNGQKVLRIINKTFEHKAFNLNELISEIEKVGYESNNVEGIMTELVKYKKVYIDKSGYILPYSVYELEKYGLSRVLIDNILIARNISFEDIDDTMREKFHVTPAKCDRILDAYKKMVIDLDIKKDLNKEIVFTIIKKNIKSKVASIEEIKEILEEKRYKLDNFEMIFDELLKENKVVFENDGYRAAYPKLIEELEKLKRDEKNMIW